MRHATLHQLKVFATLARHLNMTRAAEELHMTPAALSIQIKSLAGTVGTPLHEQIGKRLFLTEAGHLVEEASREILERLARLDSDLAGNQGLDRGKLRVSMISTVKYFLPRLLGNFCREHPGVDLALEVCNRVQILQRLNCNLDDLYFMGRPPENLTVVAIPFMENQLVVVASTDHPLAHARDVVPGGLAEEFFIMREQGSGTRLAAEQFFSAHGVRPRIRMTLGSNEAVKQAVAGGLGLAVLSRHTLAMDETSGAFAVIDVQGFPLVRHWFAVHPQGKQLGPAARAFLEQISADGRLD